MTGDMPILLGPDGPSLGGFICPVTTASAELWKIGQLHPGDKVRFQLLTIEEAEQLWREQEITLAGIVKEIKTIPTGKKPVANRLREEQLQEKQLLPEDYPVLYSNSKDFPLSVKIRCAGDACLLVEYGEMELDLRLRFRVHSLMQAIQEKQAIPVIDLTPGIRSLQLHIDMKKQRSEKQFRKL